MTIKTEWVTSINYKDSYFHITIQSVQEVHAFSPLGSVLPVQSTALWPVYSTHGAWVVRATSHQTCLQYTQTLVALSRTRLAGDLEVRTGYKTGFQLHRLPVQPERGQGQTHTRTLTGLNKQDLDNSVRSGSSCRS